MWRLMLKLTMKKTRQEALDLLDEERDLAATPSVIYQQDLRRYHSRRVKTRTFQEGDFPVWLSTQHYN